MITSTIIWTPKQWKDTLNYEDGGHYSENVDRKGGLKIQNDTQEQRMTPKMTPIIDEWNSMFLKQTS